MSKFHPTNFFIFLFIIFLLGQGSYLRDYKNTETEILTTQENTYLLIRAISKGTIAKENDKIIFITWNNIKQLKKQIKEEK